MGAINKRQAVIVIFARCGFSFISVMVRLALAHAIPYKADDIEVQILRRRVLFRLKTAPAGGITRFNSLVKSSVYFS